MRNHLRWLVPLVLAGLLYAGGTVATAWIATNKAPGGLWSAITGLIAFVAVIGVIIGLVVSLIGGLKVFRGWLRSRGMLTRSERAARDFTAARENSAQISWDRARRLRAALLAHEAPPTVAVWDLVPRADEVALLDVPATYARYYGTDVVAASSSTLFVGHPAFVLAGLAASGMSRAASARRAAAAAQAQWREWQTVRVVVTNQRIACNVGGQWLSFDYGAVAAYPEVTSWTLVCQFGNIAAPLLLAGDSGPLISVITILMTHGEAGLRDHPDLKALDATASPQTEALEP